jgi:hypothetical protein
MMSLKQFLKIERGIRTDKAESPPPRTTVGIRRAEQAAARVAQQSEAVLDALARAHEPGDVVGLPEIAKVAGVTHYTAQECRTHLRGANRWPYVDAVGGFKAAKLDAQRPGGGRGRAS